MHLVHDMVREVTWYLYFHYECRYIKRSSHQSFCPSFFVSQMLTTSSLTEYFVTYITYRYIVRTRILN
jgi:hypothetical protein